MKRGFIIFIEIALLFAVLQTSFAQYLLQDVQEEVASWFVYAADYSEREQLSELRSNLEPHMAKLNERQQKYLNELTTNKARMIKFSDDYCKGDDKNPYVYGETLKVVCAEFASSRVLFPAKNS